MDQRTIGRGHGGHIVDNPGAIAKDLKLGIDSQAGKDAAAVISKVANGGVGGPAISSRGGGRASGLFEDPGTSMFLLNRASCVGRDGAATPTRAGRRRDSQIFTTYPETVTGGTIPAFGRGHRDRGPQVQLAGAVRGRP